MNLRGRATRRRLPPSPLSPPAAACPTTTHCHPILPTFFRRATPRARRSCRNKTRDYVPEPLSALTRYPVPKLGVCVNTRLLSFAAAPRALAAITTTFNSSRPTACSALCFCLPRPTLYTGRAVRIHACDAPALRYLPALFSNGHTSIYRATNAHYALDDAASRFCFYRDLAPYDDRAEQAPRAHIAGTTT